MNRKPGFSAQDKLYDDPLANYHNPSDALDPNIAQCTHKARPMGPWIQNGKYKCATFHDPKLLTFDGEECSLEEARFRTMKPKWDQEAMAKESSVEMEEDDMMMTVNVGRIFYNKLNPDLSIPSTIKEEPSSCRTEILTDFARKSRKRKNSDEPMESLPEEPSNKRFKMGLSPNPSNSRNSNHLQPPPPSLGMGVPAVQSRDELTEMTYDIFRDDNLTVTQRTGNLTQSSHYDTPRRHLDFNHMTPGSILKERPNPLRPIPLDNDPTISMTEFFQNPIKITDRRQCDTPTVHHTKSKLFDPTKTITYHSKAALNDVVAMFGDDVDHEMVDAPSRKHSIQPTHNDDGFGIYEDTGTIHGNFVIPNISIDDDEEAVPKVERLSIIEDDEHELIGNHHGDGHHGDEHLNHQEEEEALDLPLPAIVESDNDNDPEQEIKEESTNNPGKCVMDPMDVDVMRNYDAQLLKHLLSVNAPNIINQQDEDPPVSIQSLLNGETDIELDDEDAYLNVTLYVKAMSTDNQHIFVDNVCCLCSLC